MERPQRPQPVRLLKVCGRPPSLMMLLLLLLLLLVVLLLLLLLLLPLPLPMVLLPSCHGCG